MRGPARRRSTAPRSSHNLRLCPRSPAARQGGSRPPRRRARLGSTSLRRFSRSRSRCRHRRSRPTTGTTISRKGYRSRSCKVRARFIERAYSQGTLTLWTALEKPAADASDDDRNEMEDNAQTIRPNRSPGLATIPLAQPPPAEIPPIVEDYSDMASEEDEAWLQEKVANFKVSLSLPDVSFSPNLSRAPTSSGLPPIGAG